MMTPIEAYELTLEKVEELRKAGVEIKIAASNSRENARAEEKYDRPERIPVDKWVNVNLLETSVEHTKMIYDAANYLGMCGISFDTGGGCGGRDWDLDWSFKYTGKEDVDARERRDKVEELLDEMKKGE